MKKEELGKKKFLGKGFFNKCYTLENGNVYKQFGIPNEIEDIERFKYFLKYNNSSMALPFDFVYDDCYFYGYITKKAPGIVMEKAFENSNYLDMSMQSIKVEKNIKYISEGLIMMYDFHDNNLMYDGKEFTIIDVDDYSYMPTYDSKGIAKRNISAYKCIFYNLFNSHLQNKKNTHYILDKIEQYFYSNMTASEMLYQIKEDIDKFYKEDINTTKELKKVISR